MEGDLSDLTSLMALDPQKLDPHFLFRSLSQLDPRSKLDIAATLFYVESLMDFALTNRFAFTLADILDAVIRNPSLSAIAPGLDFARAKVFKLDGRTEWLLSQVESTKDGSNPLIPRAPSPDTAGPLLPDITARQPGSPRTRGRPRGRAKPAEK
jgi:hypothetical protein